MVWTLVAETGRTTTTRTSTSPLSVLLAISDEDEEVAADGENEMTIVMMMAVTLDYFLAVLYLGITWTDSAAPQSDGMASQSLMASQ